MNHARELHTTRGEDEEDETIVDEEVSNMLANCRNILQEYVGGPTMFIGGIGVLTCTNYYALQLSGISAYH